MSPRRRQQAPRHGCESVAPGNQAACGGCWVTSGPLAAAPQQLDSPDAEASEPSKLLALLREPRLAPPPPLPRNQGACFPAQVQHPQQLGSKATWTEWRAGGGGGQAQPEQGRLLPPLAAQDPGAGGAPGTWVLSAVLTQSWAGLQCGAQDSTLSGQGPGAEGGCGGASLACHWAWGPRVGPGGRRNIPLGQPRGSRGPLQWGRGGGGGQGDGQETQAWSQIPTVVGEPLGTKETIPARLGPRALWFCSPPPPQLWAPARRRWPFWLCCREQTPGRTSPGQREWTCPGGLRARPSGLPQPSPPRPGGREEVHGLSDTALCGSWNHGASGGRTCVPTG